MNYLRSKCHPDQSPHRQSDDGDDAPNTSKINSPQITSTDYKERQSNQPQPSNRCIGHQLKHIVQSARPSSPLGARCGGPASSSHTSCSSSSTDDVTGNFEDASETEEEDNNHEDCEMIYSAPCPSPPAPRPRR